MTENHEIRKQGQLPRQSIPSEDGHPAPRLPPELIDLIIDDLGHNSSETACREALHSCTLVSNVFCMRAYRFLLSDLRIIINRKTSSSEIKIRLQRLRNILVDSLKFPHLGMVYHVQSVWLLLALQKSGFDDLPAILDALHGPNRGISRFSFVILPSGFQGLGLSSRLFRSPRFSKAFQNLCRSPKLTWLHVRNLIFVPRSIFCGTNIKHLTLENLGPLQESEERPHSDIVQPKSLTLSRCIPFAKIVDIFHSDHTLDMHLRYQQIFALLEEITIENNPLMPLGLMPHLRSVCFVQRLGLAEEPDAGKAISRVNDFFSRPECNIPSTVTHLKIETKYLGPRAFTDLHSSYGHWEKAKEQWDVLDTHITGPLLHNVQDIRLVIRFGRPTTRDLLPSETTFLDRNLQVVWSLLPRVVALRPTFSLELLVDPEPNISTLSTVIQCKGPHTEWW